MASSKNTGTKGTGGEQGRTTPRASGARPGKPAERASDAGDANPSSDQMAERHQRISEAAYRLAEQRGFDADRQLDDWLQAERELGDLSIDEQA